MNAVNQTINHQQSSALIAFEAGDILSCALIAFEAGDTLSCALIAFEASDILSCVVGNIHRPSDAAVKLKHQARCNQ